MFLQTEGLASSDAPAPAEPQRCVIVVDERLTPGKASNAAAVIAFTLGQRHSHLVGAQMLDKDGGAHPGLIPIGIPILKATEQQLIELRQNALTYCDVVDFPVEGQATTDYEAFLKAVSMLPGDSFRYLAVGLVGGKKKVGKLVGGFALFS